MVEDRGGLRKPEIRNVADDSLIKWISRYQALFSCDLALNVSSARDNYGLYEFHLSAMKETGIKEHHKS